MWKIGRIEKLIQSKDGRMRSAEVVLPNRTTIVRPINLLYPLEVAAISIEEAKLPTTAPENEAPSVDARVPNQSSMHFGLQMHSAMLFLILCIVMQSVSGLALHRSYLLCSGGKSGHPIAVPRKFHCKFPPNQHLQWRNVKLWVQREEPQQTVAYHCYLQQHKIVTRMGLVGGKGIIGDLTEYSSVPAYACWQATQTKKWNDKYLVEVVPGLWSTNNTLEVSYRWCCYDVENVANNFFLEEGEVASIDGRKIVSDLQDLSACLPTSGHCQDHRKGTTVWNGTVFKDECSYVFHGAYSGTMSGFALVVLEIQGAFSYSGQRHPPGSECVPSGAFYTDQGAVFISFEGNQSPLHWLEMANRSLPAKAPPDIEHEDLSAYKHLFLFKKLQQVEEQQFGLLWQQICLLRQNHLNLVWQLFRIDPTLGIRALLGKDNLHAEWAGEALIFWTCRNVTPVTVYWMGQVNSTCYKYTPVQIEPGGLLWFVMPGSRDLTPSSPVEDCSHTTTHLFQDDKGQWHSAHGPVHVTDLPLEIVWKGLWTAFTFKAPSLFRNFYSRIPTFSETRYQLQRLARIEEVMNRLVNYTAGMSLDPNVIYYAISGVGDGLGHLIEGAGHAVGHMISGVADGVGTLLSELLKGPLQLFLNVLVIVVSIGLTIFILLKLVQWRKAKGKLSICGQTTTKPKTMTQSVDSIEKGLGKSEEELFELKSIPFMDVSDKLSVPETTDTLTKTTPQSYRLRHVIASH